MNKRTIIAMFVVARNHGIMKENLSVVLSKYREITKDFHGSETEKANAVINGEIK